MYILVAGSTGFVGRAVTKALKAKGHTVIPYHRGFRAVPTHADAIVNCVGILREDLGSFKTAHVDITKFLLKLAKKLHVKQYVHISAIGADLEVTAYQKTKRQAERLIEKSRVPYVIIRPSVIFGPHDRSVNMIRSLCRTGFYPSIAEGKVQPVHIDTVAALVVAAVDRRVRNRIVEVGGPEIFTWAQLARRVHPGVRVLTMPRWFAGVLNGLSPLFVSLPTKDMVTMMRQSNVTSDTSVWKLRIDNPKVT